MTAPTAAGSAAGSAATAPRASYPDLRGRIAIVTGIGQVGDQTMWGNGAAFALTLARNGVKVLGCDLRLSAAQHTQARVQADAEVIASGGECKVMACDVTKASAVEGLVKTCVAEYGRVDILVNNVGMSMPGAAGDMPEDVWDAQMDVNLKSVYLMCHAVLPIMEAQGGGSIINMASIAAKAYIGKAQIAYNATKAAVIQFSRATAVHYAPRGVRVNVIVPGLIHTPLVGVLAEKYAGGDYEGLAKRRAEAVPMGRMGDAFDVANAGAFLASEVSRYITGVEMLVDGGITSTTGWSSG
jgi:NAD(P)-dependent dehydrogenase (short-subunit alcohol dehydrogenase family)